MTDLELTLSRTHSQLLMEVASTLALQTQKADDFRTLPAYLAAAFNLPAVALAVVKTVTDGDLILLSGYSLPQTATFEQDLLDIHSHTRPLSTQDGPAIRASAELQKADVESTSAFPHSTVFTQVIDDKHRLLLIIQQPADDQLSTDLTALLQLVTQQLGKCLTALIMWMTYPRELGAPFDRLTDREWMVLRGLNTDAGEKQLADQLGLSPHTLHSHIKAIYRKVGVQGRLSLLRRVEESLRTHRLQRALRPVELIQKPNGRARAIG